MKTYQINYSKIYFLVCGITLLISSLTCTAQLDVDINNRVGIGTSSPGQKLEVNGSIYVNAEQSFIGADAAGNSRLGFVKKSGTYPVIASGSATPIIFSIASGTAPNIAGNITNGSFAEKVRIATSGNMGIGTAAPGYKLDVQGSAGVVNINTNGNMQAAGTLYTSDQMFKTGIDSLNNALATISQLKPKSYYFDTVIFNGEGKFNFPSVKQYGFIAQDVEAIMPELVLVSTKPASTDSSGNIVNPAYQYRALNYIGFISILTKGIQEQQNQIDSLTAKLGFEQLKSADQDAINTALQNQLNQLSERLKSCCTLGEMRSTSTNATYAHQTDIKLTNAQSIVLEQNVPNPFAEQTSISYYLPDNVQKAQMLFYNAQGRVIQTVDLKEKGKGMVNVFASDLSNGIYTYTLVVDGKIIETKKMIKQ